MMILMMDNIQLTLPMIICARCKGTGYTGPVSCPDCENVGKLWIYNGKSITGRECNKLKQNMMNETKIIYCRLTKSKPNKTDCNLCSIHIIDWGGFLKLKKVYKCPIWNTKPRLGTKIQIPA